MKQYFIFLYISIFLAIAIGSIVRSPFAVAREDRPAQGDVDRAIARGVGFLKANQRDDGSWRYVYNGDHVLGITALAGLALLENGVSRDDRAIGRAEQIVLRFAEDCDQTYDLSLAILFLARVEPTRGGRYDDLITRLGGRLAAGGRGGLWNYNVPIDPGTPTGEPGIVTGTPGVNEGSPGRTGGTHGRASTIRNRPPRRKNASDNVPGDNSNTQFALLGLWAASRHGLDVNGELSDIDGHFRDSQESTGRWGYRPGIGGSDAMTCAGLLGLAIGASRPELAERRSSRARGADLAADPAFQNALRAVAEGARSINRSQDIYAIWSLERVCVALGLRDLEGFDWYARGANVLLARQISDGSWRNGRWGVLPDTSLALLFLRKANLAFELDRVLKLPSPNAPKTPDEADPSIIGKLYLSKNIRTPNSNSAGKDSASSEGDATVVVSGADEAKFPEIAVDFLIQKPDGEPLVDAVQNDIHVYENEREMEILSFNGPSGSTPRPTTVVLVVDKSKSMEDENRIDGLKQAVGVFLAGVPKGSRVAVIAFGSDVDLIAPFGDDYQAIRTAVDALKPEGATRYYDAVTRALEMLSHEKGRRAVLALTDGEDTFSRDATLDSSANLAIKLGLPVHTLGLGGDDEIASVDLKELARRTRGTYYPAKRVEDLKSIYQELARNLKNSYSLVYKTDRRLPDGTLRPIKVSYRTGRNFGKTEVFIRGMVVPAAGPRGLFLFLLACLVALAIAPGILKNRGATTH